MDDPWTDGRVYYLLLLGVFVLVWVFRNYRHRLGTAVQHAAIWVLIFIGVILAIGFKDDLTRILSGGPEQIDGQTVVAGAAALDAHVARKAAQQGVDLTFLRTIPGSIGGAVRMNAGCYGSYTADAFIEARAV